MSAGGKGHCNVPLWYLTTFDAVQHLEGGLRNLELELTGVLRLDGLDCRVRRELEGVLESLHAVMGHLVLVDTTARAVLDETLGEAA